MPALTEKLLPTFTNKKDAAPTKKPPNRILSITADVTRMKLYVLSDYSKLTSGVLAITMDTALEFVDRNRDAKISLRLQNLQMGTVHHQISSQKASVLHSASIDFVMSNSQVCEIHKIIICNTSNMVIGSSHFHYSELGYSSIVFVASRCIKPEFPFSSIF